MKYQTSTQRKNWLFTEQQLSERRRENRQRSLEVIQKLREESGPPQVREAVDGERDTKKPGKLKAISVEDEAKLLKYYAGKIQDISRALSFPQKVPATALMYLKRAYLSFSALDHDPKDVMLSCIYLAGKIEESYIGAEEFCRVVKQQESVVLRGEIILLEALKFDLIVYTPYRALQGFLLELEELQSKDKSIVEGSFESKLNATRTKAQGAADVLMLSDAPLLFPPGQLALAAVRSAMKSVGLQFDVFLEHVCRKLHAEKEGQVQLPDLKAALGNIDAFGVEGASPVNEQEVRKIDRRLKQCHNLLLDPSSEEFKKAASEKQQQLDIARQQKAAAKRARIAAREQALLGIAKDNNVSTALAEQHNAWAEPQQHVNAGESAVLDPTVKRRRSEL